MSYVVIKNVYIDVMLILCSKIRIKKNIFFLENVGISSWRSFVRAFKRRFIGEYERQDLLEVLIATRGICAC